MDDKPEFVTEEHLLFLDGLRETGICNMFGAAPYLQELFPMPYREAKQIILHWIRTFGERHP